MKKELFQALLDGKKISHPAITPGFIEYRNGCFLDSEGKKVDLNSLGGECWFVCQERPKDSWANIFIDKEGRIELGNHITYSTYEEAVKWNPHLNSSYLKTINLADIKEIWEK